MASRVRIPPGAVHDTLRRHLLAGGYPIVLDLEKSQGAFAYDSLTGDRYLDFGSFYGSNPLGYAHPGMLEPDVQARLSRAATVKVGNPDFYTEYFAEFVDTLSRTAAPPEARPAKIRPPRCRGPRSGSAPRIAFPKQFEHSFDGSRVHRRTR